MNLNPVRDALQKAIYVVINPFVRLLIKLGFTPNAVTLTGLLLNIGVAVLFIAGAEEGNRGDLSFVGWGGGLILFAGLFDMLDGQVARLGNMKSDYGALFDSVLDRYSELFTFLGICYYLVAHHYFLSSLFAFVGLIGSMMVSYTRARAEGLAIECKGGLMQRPERVVLVGVSALACGIASAYLGGDYKLFVPGISFHVFETMTVFTFPLAVLAVLTNVTAVSRLLQARRALEQKAQLAAPAPAVAARPEVVVTAAVVVLGLLLHLPQLAQATGRPTTDFPVPAGVTNQLFYLQRDPNTNTVIYQLNVKAGQLDEENPVRVFWIRYAEKGQFSELSYIQRKFAYGISTKKIGPERYELKFAAYGKIPFFLQRFKADNAYHVYANLNGRQLLLDRVFLRIEGGTFWVPNVRYIELKGRNAATQAPLTERITLS